MLKNVWPEKCSSPTRWDTSHLKRSMASQRIQHTPWDVISDTFFVPLIMMGRGDLNNDNDCCSRFRKIVPSMCFPQARRSVFIRTLTGCREKPVAVKLTRGAAAAAEVEAAGEGMNKVVLAAVHDAVNGLIGNKSFISKLSSLVSRKTFDSSVKEAAKKVSV